MHHLLSYRLRFWNLAFWLWKCLSTTFPTLFLNIEVIYREVKKDVTAWASFPLKIFGTSWRKSTEKVLFIQYKKIEMFSNSVICATSAAGKTIFCWQLLEQLHEKGESCVFCSYEMSALELFSKSMSRELYRCCPHTALTSADIRCLLRLLADHSAFKRYATFLG